MVYNNTRIIIDLFCYGQAPKHSYAQDVVRAYTACVVLASMETHTTTMIMKNGATSLTMRTIMRAWVPHSRALVTPLGAH